VWLYFFIILNFFILIFFIVFLVVRTRGRDGRIIRYGGRDEPIRHHVVQQQDEEEQHYEEQHLEQPAPLEQPPPAVEHQPHQQWGGGPIDTSLLTRYNEHVARYLWFGQVINLFLYKL
jgi:hypothetical protein